MSVIRPLPPVKRCAYVGTSPMSVARGISHRHVAPHEAAEKNKPGLPSAEPMPSMRERRSAI